MPNKEMFWTIGELAAAILRLVFMGSVLLFLFLIAEDIEAIRNHQVPSDLDVLFEQNNRIIDTIKRGYP